MSDPTEPSSHTPAPPANPDGPQLRPHVFDGIQEYDQKLPNWWLMTFYFAIIWFVLYWTLYYQGGFFSSDHDRVTSQLQAIQVNKNKELEKMLSTLDNKVLWTWSKDEGVKSEGQAIYTRICAACHAADLSAKLGGAPLPGLPLNDAEWKYGNQPMDVFRMVSKGSPDKTQAIQMPPWEAVLSPAEIAKVSAFVMSHHTAPAP
jgi:cytochrome c oxidase cbb3-type subunit III